MAGNFSKTISETYDLYKRLHHFNLELQEKIGLLLNKHFQYCENDEIKILEIGPGLGHTTIKILNANQNINVIGVDNNKGMIEKIQNEFERVTLINDDILNFMQKNKSKYHGIVSAMTLHTFNKNYRSEVLKYCQDSLYEGGIFVNGDKYSQDQFFTRTYHALIELGILAKNLIPEGEFKLFTNWVNHYIIDAKKEIIMKEKESIKEMKEIGFINIDNVYRNHLNAIICAYK